MFIGIVEDWLKIIDSDISVDILLVKSVVLVGKSVDDVIISDDVVDGSLFNDEIVSDENSVVKIASVDVGVVKSVGIFSESVEDIGVVVKSFKRGVTLFSVVDGIFRVVESTLTIVFNSLLLLVFVSVCIVAVGMFWAKLISSFWIVDNSKEVGETDTVSVVDDKSKVVWSIVDISVVVSDAVKISVVEIFESSVDSTIEELNLLFGRSTSLFLRFMPSEVDLLVLVFNVVVALLKVSFSLYVTVESIRLVSSGFILTSIKFAVTKSFEVSVYGIVVTYYKSIKKIYNHWIYTLITKSVNFNHYFYNRYKIINNISLKNITINPASVAWLNNTRVVTCLHIMVE